MANYEDLRVWQRAHELALQVYKETASFPKAEQYSLTQQMRRAATSISINIAEGCGRLHRKELVQFANIARGSASELEYQLLLARDLGYLYADDYNRLNKDVKAVSSMLSGLIRSFEKGKRTK